MGGESVNEPVLKVTPVQVVWKDLDLIHIRNRRSFDANILSGTLGRHVAQGCRRWVYGLDQFGRRRTAIHEFGVSEGGTITSNMVEAGEVVADDFVAGLPVSTPGAKLGSVSTSFSTLGPKPMAMYWNRQSGSGQT
ncbi:hypothetical protein P8C59_005172 [Phyllachora maydis]|uniref:Uncharacterized protein n=1 Tax=Phyllachora maydis TaxID=1825666 RepID=A0AAD9MBZ3_9PEZI|nr:hypothetical protein P8C59_005172 [Phyllachora maydis]